MKSISGIDRVRLKTIDPDRLDKRIIGNLGGRSLNRAKRLVNAAIGELSITNNNSNNTAQKELGSIWIFEVCDREINYRYQRSYIDHLHG